MGHPHLWPAALIVLLAFILLVIGLIFFPTLIANGAMLAVVGIILATLVIAALIVGLALVTRTETRGDGRELFVGQIATVIADLAPSGRVLLHGVDWAAMLDSPYAGYVVPKGAQVRVVAVQDLLLIVVPAIPVMPPPAAPSQPAR